MRDKLTSINSEYEALSRLAIYIVIIAWILLGIYIYIVSQHEVLTTNIISYFLSTEQSGVKFRALVLLAPFVLTVISYLLSEKAKLFRKTISAENDLQSLFNGLIVAFAKALDAKSPWTMGHSERVTSYALLIAGHMHVDNNDMETLKIAGLLHDIGKLGTYDVILDKPGPLTDKEWELVMMHPGKGASILKPIKQLQNVIPIIKHHHERFDGKGYPDGLKDKEIPLLARILCLADSFDAMSADRPYKKALTKEKAASEIKNKIGTQFDPDVAEAFLHIINIDSSLQDDLIPPDAVTKSP